MAWSIAIHGGSGSMTRETLTQAAQAQHLTALGTARDAGAHLLANGASALEAVVAAVAMLEDDPRFNAGRGAVFT